LEGKVLTTWAPNYQLRINNKQAVRIFRCFVRKKEEAKTNPKKALTDNMKVSLAELIEKDKPDELPPGAITWKEFFRDVFWSEEDYSIINIWIKENI
jgi:hypothetical protein